MLKKVTSYIIIIINSFRKNIICNIFKNDFIEIYTEDTASKAKQCIGIVFCTDKNIPICKM